MLRYGLDCVHACVFASQVKHTKRAWKAASSRARISVHRTSVAEDYVTVALIRK